MLRVLLALLACLAVPFRFPDRRAALTRSDSEAQSRRGKMFRFAVRLLPACDAKASRESRA